MPIITNTQLSAVRKANTVMSTALFTRAKRWIHTKVCGSYDTTSFVEPHAIGGSAPIMRKYTGKLAGRGMPSYTLNVPNELYKNFLEIDRSELEGDQTHTLIRKAEQVGIRVAELPEYLWVKRILAGHTTASVTTRFNNVNYTTTLDGLPFFSLVHKLDGVTSQANIVEGYLPATVDAVLAQDVAVSANQMQLTLMKIIHRIKTVKDDQGTPIYPSLDPKESIVVVVNSALENIAKQAFQTIGTLAGSGGSTGGSGSTTTIGPTLVKDVVSSGLLDGVPDVESETLTTVAPANETEFYVFIVDDYVRPFYRQLFKPAGPSDLFPSGYSIDGEVSRIISANNMSDVKIDKAAATLYAGSIVEHNLDAVGSNAQRSVVVDEKHFISGRSRMAIAYGPWFTGWKASPVGTST